MCISYRIRYQGCYSSLKGPPLGKRGMSSCIKEVSQIREYVDSDGMQLCRKNELKDQPHCERIQEKLFYFSNPYCSNECEWHRRQPQMPSNAASNQWEYIDDTDKDHPHIGDLRIDCQRVGELYEGLEAFVRTIGSANEKPNLDYPIIKSWPAMVVATFLSSAAGQKSVQVYAGLYADDKKKFLQRMMGDLDIAGPQLHTFSVHSVLLSLLGYPSDAKGPPPKSDKITNSLPLKVQKSDANFRKLLVSGLKSLRQWAQPSTKAYEQIVKGLEGYKRKLARDLGYEPLPIQRSSTSTLVGTATGPQSYQPAIDETPAYGAADLMYQLDPQSTGQELVSIQRGLSQRGQIQPGYQQSPFQPGPMDQSLVGRAHNASYLAYPDVNPPYMQQYGQYGAYGGNDVPGMNASALSHTGFDLQGHHSYGQYGGDQMNLPQTQYGSASNEFSSGQCEGQSTSAHQGVAGYGEFDSNADQPAYGQGLYDEDNPYNAWSREPTQGGGGSKRPPGGEAFGKRTSKPSTSDPKSRSTSPAPDAGPHQPGRSNAQTVRQNDRRTISPSRPPVLGSSSGASLPPTAGTQAPPARGNRNNQPEKSSNLRDSPELMTTQGTEPKDLKRERRQGTSSSTDSDRPPRKAPNKVAGDSKRQAK